MQDLQQYLFLKIKYVNIMETAVFVAILNEIKETDVGKMIMVDEKTQ